jgi:hypothetical protein
MSNINNFDTSFDNYEDTLSNGSQSFNNMLKGTEVVLVDSDNPWYLNQELRVATKYIPSEFSLEFKDDNPYKQSTHVKQGRYKTELSTDQQAKLLKTHSFLERKLITENREFFNNKNGDNMNRNILIILLLILAVIYFYKVYKK